MHCRCILRTPCTDAARALDLRAAHGARAGELLGSRCAAFGQARRPRRQRRASAQTASLSPPAQLPGAAWFPCRICTASQLPPNPGASSPHARAGAPLRKPPPCAPMSCWTCTEHACQGAALRPPLADSAAQALACHSIALSPRALPPPHSRSHPSPSARRKPPPAAGQGHCHRVKL